MTLFEVLASSIIIKHAPNKELYSLLIKCVFSGQKFTANDTF